jgi:hypothetical protein
MTCQIPNLYRYRGEYCWTPDVDDEGIIDRDTFPELRTAYNCTACYRKFIAYFDIDEERGLLVLDELEGLERENPPDIDGVKARIMLWNEVTTDMQGEPRGCVYKLAKPIAWSGKMRLVKQQSRDLVAECFFENGELVKVNDLTGTKLTEYKAPSMAEADLREVAKILKKFPSEKAIRSKAYELWQERGCPEGTAEQDWYDAERMLFGR